MHKKITTSQVASLLRNFPRSSAILMRPSCSIGLRLIRLLRNWLWLWFLLWLMKIFIQTRIPHILWFRIGFSLLLLIWFVIILRIYIFRFFLGLLIRFIIWRICVLWFSFLLLIRPVIVA